jgi:colicin import membrane protein
MNRTITRQRQNRGLWLTVCCSVVLHLTVYFFILNFQFPVRFKEAPVYYVDMVNLPVAHPQAGTPGTSASLSAQPATPPQPREMVLPAKPAAPPPARQQTAPPKTTEAPESAREFEERLARLENEAGARHQAAALETLKKRGSGKGTVGMPGAVGNEAGSDYASYIRSRLEDEFKTTIAFQTKNPELLVKLTISQNGRIIRQQIMKSSKDKMFEDSVLRSILKAERNFRPPPSGNQFEIDVRFSPQGIGKK